MHASSLSAKYKLSVATELTHIYIVTIMPYFHIHTGIPCIIDIIIILITVTYISLNKRSAINCKSHI